METHDLSYEDTVAGVELILETLGFPLLGLTDGGDLYAALSLSLRSRDTDLIDRLLRLGERLAQGFNPQREIAKLAKRLEPPPSQTPKSLSGTIVFPIRPQTLSVNMQITSGNLNGIGAREPWEYRNKLAESRLPNTGGMFSRPIRNRQVHRGPGRYK